MYAGEVRPWELPWRGALVRVVLDWRPSPVRARGAVLALLNGDRGRRWATKTEMGEQAPGHHRWVTYHADPCGFVVSVRGPDAWEEADHLASLLGSVRDQSGRVVTVDSVEVERAECLVGLDAKRWHRYALDSPLFPARSAAERAPDPAHWSYPAWAGQVIASALRGFLTECGWNGEPNRPLAVQVERVAPESVVWARKGRARDERVGLRADFISNAILPPWCSIGARTAEGWGVVRECDG